MDLPARQRVDRDVIEVEEEKQGQAGI